MPKLMAGLIIVAVSVALIRAGVRKEKPDPQLQSPLPKSERAGGLPLNNPPFTLAAQAQHMQDSDLVIGVVTPQGARAYPWWLMNKHQIVNDTWNGTPITVTLCPVATGVAAFVAQVEDMQEETTLSFRTCGFASGTFEMCDDQTLSRWHPQRGMAHEGRLSGYSLPRLFTSVVDWGTWKRQFPESEVVLSARALVHPQQLQSQAEQWGAPEIPSHYQPVGEIDQRLPPSSVVLGLLPTDGVSETALSLNALDNQIQVIDLEGSPLLVVPLGGRSARAFWLNQNPREGWLFDEKALQLVHGEHRWNLLGESLSSQDPIKVADGYISEWFAWASTWPETQIYPPPAREVNP